LFLDKPSKLALTLRADFPFTSLFANLTRFHRPKSSALVAMHLLSHVRFNISSHSNPHGHYPLAMPALATRNTNSTATTDDSIYTHGLAGVNQIENYFFVNAVLIFFFGLAALVLLVRISHNIRGYLRHINSIGAGNGRQTYWTQNQTVWWPWVKRHIVYAPLWDKHHNAEIKIQIKKSPAISLGTLPSRYHAILLAIYVFSNIAYCLLLDYSQQNKSALLAGLRGRSGALAIINLIPTILFALRNNPLISLLHVSYDTFNLFHRWAGRMVVLEAFLHVLAWAIVSVDALGWHGMINLLEKSVSYQWGTVGMVLTMIITLLAWSPVRHAAYETFLNIHRLLALFTLIGVYVHLDASKLPQLPYIQLVAFFWITEWIFRATRLIISNFSRDKMTQCTVEALPGEACRVTFSLARPWKFRPGAHVHAYIPAIGLWSSHPFSVAWTEDHVVHETKTPQSSSGTSHDKATDVVEITDSQLESAVPIVTTRITHTSVTLIMKAKSGMTRKLYNAAAAAETRTITGFGMIEGPYGGQDSLDSYGTVVLFAAGVGITHQLGYARHLLQGFEAGTVATRRIVLAWTVPDMECLAWIRPCLEQLLAMESRQDVFKLMVFISKRSPTETAAVSLSGSIIIDSGRCKVQKIVDYEFANRIGAMAVTVCGPGVFADDVREVVRGKVELGCIDLVEESFTY